MFDDETGPFAVVINRLGNTSVWPSTRENAPGWHDEGFIGSLQDCLDHIDSTVRETPPDAGDVADERGSLVPIPETFALMARSQPHSTAIVDADQSWTFQRLRAEAEAISAGLTAAGYGRGARVGVLLSRSNWFAAAAFGIMEAGMTVVPLDATEPVTRLQAVAREAGLAVVLVDDETAAPGAELGGCVRVDGFARAHGYVPIWPALSAAAYVVFTSGSTGTPKGVVVSHLAFASLLASHQSRHHAHARRLAARDLRVAHTTSVAFDLSWDAFAWMLSGHTVHMVDDAVRRDIPALVEYLDASRIDVMECTPSQVEQMVTAGYLAPGTHQPTLIAVGGESVSPELWSFLRDAGPVAYNFYGPTEFTVDALVSEIVGSRPVVGYPQAGCYVRILDRSGRPAPDGESGEIYLGGPQLAIGYLNAPALTAERFLPDPCAEELGLVLYRTGDLGAMTDTGVEFFGRADRQVKVRGVRIELGEIESTIRSADGVIGSVVIPIVMDGRVTGLSAFVVLAPGVDVSTVEDFVEARLPAHMVPGTMTAVVQIPLRSSGKVDEAALRGLETAAALEKRENRPVGELEVSIARLWSDVLGHTVNDRHANFFCVGGHSLSAVELLARMNSTLHTSLPLSLMFEAPTVRLLGLAILQEKSAVLAAATRPG